jgi:hypothetical protein
MIQGTLVLRVSNADVIEAVRRYFNAEFAEPVAVVSVRTEPQNGYSSGPVDIGTDSQSFIVTLEPVKNKPVKGEPSHDDGASWPLHG